MILLKWIIIILYGLVIVGNLMEMHKTQNIEQIKTEFLATLVLALPIIYMLGDKI